MIPAVLAGKEKKPLLAQVPESAPPSKKVKVKESPFEITSKRTGLTYQTKSGKRPTPAELEELEAYDLQVFSDRQAEDAGQKKMVAGGNQLGVTPVEPMPVPMMFKTGGAPLTRAQRVAASARSKPDSIAQQLEPVREAVDRGIQTVMDSPVNWPGFIGKQIAENLPGQAGTIARGVGTGVQNFAKGMVNPIGMAQMADQVATDPVGAAKGMTVDQVQTVFNPNAPLDQRVTSALNIAMLAYGASHGAAKIGKGVATVRAANELASNLGINPVQAAQILKQLDNALASDPQLSAAVKAKIVYPEPKPKPTLTPPVEKPPAKSFEETATRVPTAPQKVKSNPANSNPRVFPKIEQDLAAQIAPFPKPEPQPKPSLLPKVESPEPTATPEPATTVATPEPVAADASAPVAKKPWQMTGEELFAQLNEVRQGKAKKIGGGHEVRRESYVDYVKLEKAQRDGSKIGIDRMTEEVARVNHKNAVESALKEGKPVPPEVLADYPDLAAKYAKSPVSNEPTPPAPVSVPAAPKQEVQLPNVPENGVASQVEGQPASSEVPVPAVKKFDKPKPNPIPPRKPTEGPRPPAESAANADTAKLRERLGMEERVKPEPQANEKTIAKANESYTPELADTIVDTIRKNPKRSASAEEVIQIERRSLELQSEYEKAHTAIEKASTSLEIEAATKKRDALFQRLEATADALETTGTGTAQALQIRRALVRPDEFSYAGLRREYKAGLKRSVTPEESELIRKQADEISDLQKKLEEAQSKKLQAEVAKVQAKTARKAITDQAREAIRTRMLETTRAAVADAKKALRSAAVGSAPGQTFVELAQSLAPHVKSLIKDLAELGTVELKAVTAEVRAIFKDSGIDMTDADVHDVLRGVYDTPQPRDKTPYQKLKDEAVQIHRERAEEQAKIAKDATNAEKAKARQREQYEREQVKRVEAGERKAYQDAEKAQAKIERDRLAQARKEGKAQEAAARRDYKQYWENSVEGKRERLFARIADPGKMGPPKPKADTFADDPIVRDLTIQLEAKKIQAKRALAQAKAKAEYESLTPNQKAVAQAYGAGNSLRSIVASTDLSAFMNQGFFYTMTNPVKSFASFFRSIGDAATPDKLDASLAEVRTNPYYSKAKAGKLAIDAAEGSAADDYLALNKALTEGKYNPIGFSERAYKSYVTRIRMDMFASVAKSLEQGKTLTLNDYKQIAEYVNNVTGTISGEIPGGKIASATLFAPKYMIARGKTAFAIPIVEALAKGNKPLAWKIAKDYARFAVAIGGLAFVANQTGMPVDLNPRSKKFMKGTAGNVEVDFSGGLAQFHRLLASLAERPLNDITGETYQNGKPVKKYSEFTSKDTAEKVGDFLQGKASPVAKVIMNQLDQQSFGKSYKLNTEEGIKNMGLSLLPISVQNGVELSQDPRLTPQEKALIGLLGALGVPIRQTFLNPKTGK